MAIAVCVLVLVADVRNAIGFSSFGVLLYFVANLAAFTQTAPHRRWPRALQVLGAVGCGTLAATLPWQTIAAGVAVLAIGVALRALLSTSASRPRGRRPAVEAVGQPAPGASPSARPRLD